MPGGLRERAMVQSDGRRAGGRTRQAGVAESVTRSRRCYGRLVTRALGEEFRFPCGRPPARGPRRCCCALAGSSASSSSYPAPPPSLTPPPSLLAPLPPSMSSGTGLKAIAPVPSAADFLDIVCVPFSLQGCRSFRPALLCTGVFLRLLAALGWTIQRSSAGSC